MYFIIFMVAFYLRPGTDTRPSFVSENRTDSNGSIYTVNITLKDPCYLLRTDTAVDVVSQYLPACLPLCRPSHISATSCFTLPFVCLLVCSVPLGSSDPGSDDTDWCHLVCVSVTKGSLSSRIQDLLQDVGKHISRDLFNVISSVNFLSRMCCLSLHFIT